jgi:hypothetical protein
VKDEKTGLSNRHLVLKPIVNLFAGVKNGKQFRRIIMEKAKSEPTFDGLVTDAIQCLSSEVLDQR